MFNPDNYEEIREKFPIQVAEAEQIRGVIGDAYIKSIGDLFPGASIFHRVVHGYADIKIKLFKAKLQIFIEGSDLKKKEINTFLSNCSDEEEIWLEEFIFETLSSADEKEKCRLYGFIFRELVLGKISDKEAKRLIYAVKNLFVEDLEQLGSYSPQKIGDDDVSVPLKNAGLLQDNGFTGGVISDEGEEEENSGTIYSLSTRGKLLLKILQDHSWLPVVSKP